MPLYKLKKPHTHAGKDYDAGEHVEVRQAIAERLPDTFGEPITETAPVKAGAKPKE